MIFAFVFVCLSPRDPRGSVVWDALSSASFEKDSISIPLTQTACERERGKRGEEREAGKEGKRRKRTRVDGSSGRRGEMFKITLSIFLSLVRSLSLLRLPLFSFPVK